VTSLDDKTWVQTLSIRKRPVCRDPLPVRDQQPYFIPERSAPELWIAALLFVATCLYLLSFYSYTAMNSDEGVVLQGAQRILGGQVMYRDFFSPYTPGSYYWIALLFKIFGNSLLVGRAALIVYGGAFSVVTYLLARRLCSRWSALLACYMVTVAGLPYRFLVLQNWHSAVLTCLTLYCATRLLENGAVGWAAATGSLSALTLLSEQSKGAGLLLGLTIGWVLIWVLRRERVALNFRRSFALALGFAWPFVLCFGYFAWKRSLPVMLAGWAWPLARYSIANAVPYGFAVSTSPSGEGLFSGSLGSSMLAALVAGPLFVLPIVPLAGAAALAWAVLRRKVSTSSDLRQKYLVLLLSVSSGLLLSVLATRRPDFTHFTYLAPVYYLVLAVLLDGLGFRSRLWNKAAPIAVLYLFFSFTCFGMTLLLPALEASKKVAMAHGTVRTSDPDQDLEYVQAHVASGEKILVYPYAPLYYYLTATQSPTYFDYMQLGMHTPEQFQRAQMELAVERPRVVLYEISFVEKIPMAWPSTPLHSIAARDPLADYIVENYRPCSLLTPNGFWRFLFMVRKDTACPARG
jgi:4-amino-4-deoxy-L-arabinose transferase-like glycosyltransferase